MLNLRIIHLMLIIPLVSCFIKEEITRDVSDLRIKWDSLNIKLLHLKEKIDVEESRFKYCYDYYTQQDTTVVDFGNKDLSEKISEESSTLKEINSEWTEFSFVWYKTGDEIEQLEKWIDKNEIGKVFISKDTLAFYLRQDSRVLDDCQRKIKKWSQKLNKIKAFHFSLCTFLSEIKP